MNPIMAHCAQSVFTYLYLKISERKSREYLNFDNENKKQKIRNFCSERINKFLKVSVVL